MCLESNVCDEGEQNNIIDSQQRYSHLQMSTMHDALNPESENYTSLLLPSFVQPSDNVQVYVQGMDDSVKTVATKIVAQQYLSQLTKERDDALNVARSYRDQVDALRTRNRKLYCEMNDRVDTIRNFWRNNIVEGSTRAGRCVRKAIKKIYINIIFDFFIIINGIYE